MSNFKQGIFTPQNKKKYIGDANKIVYRSGWEKRVMHWMDRSKNILKWGSEELIIPYFYEGDGKSHRYFPDFLIEYRDGKGQIKRMIIEVKPFKETLEPKPPKRMTAKGKRRFLTEILTWKKNQNKWESATAYAKKNGMEFKVMTEYDIYGKKGKV